MLIEHQHPKNKSIMLTILGATNVGKSSLINYLMGIDLSVVTNRPQTTRNRFHCVFTVDRTEIILVDTPGLHRSNKEINKRMNQQAKEGSFGSAVQLLLIDLSVDVLQQFKDFKYHLENSSTPIWAVFTKSDLITEIEKLPVDNILGVVKEFLPSIEKHFIVSSVTGDNVHQLIGAICDRAPSSPHHYKEGRLSNKNERFFVSEYIREQAFELLKEEVPYEVAVTIDEYKDLDGNDVKKSNIVSHISASILVNRPSQRAIVVGTKGSMIKEIGTRARRRIETLLGGQIHLNLHVKVSERWFKNNFILEELGLPRAENSARVWRSK